MTAGRFAASRTQFTDRAEWRLTEHFFRAMFDFGFLSDFAADSFKRVLFGSVGGFIAFGLLLTRIYMAKYTVIRASGSRERYERALLGDDLMIIGLPMLLVAFVTLLSSHSLFPDERDFRILGQLPVPRLIVFRAKFTALLMFTGLFIAAAHVALFPLMVLMSLNPWGDITIVLRIIAWGIAGITGSAFAVLGIAAVVGVLVLALSRSRLEALSTLMRSIVLALLVMCLPAVSHLPALSHALSSGSSWMVLVPPAWFLGLERVLYDNADAWLSQLAVIGAVATLTVAGIVAITYIVLFKNFERLMMRPASMKAPWWHRTQLRWPKRSAPAFRGVFGFTLATLKRSQLHQGVLVGLSACGVGLAASFLPSFSLITSSTIVPFLLMFACGVGVRAALALPIERRANWIFQVTEDRAVRREQMRAVDRVVLSYVVGVPLVATLPLLWFALGTDTPIGAVVIAAIGFVFVHAVLLDWRRIPFTCSYLPGKRFIGHSALIGFAACLLFTLFSAGLMRSALLSPHLGLSIVAALLVVGFWLRERRLLNWATMPLMFEDEFPDQPIRLQL
jgi:hypothetical protein